MHGALRQRRGEHVAQKGSMGAPERLRFDYSHPAAIARDDLAWIEAKVNRRVRGNSEVTTRLMTPQAAIDEGAMAQVGEKYGDAVRVDAMGGAAARGNRAARWTRLLCGTPSQRTRPTRPARESG